MGKKQDGPREGRIRMDGGPAWPCYFYGDSTQPYFDLATVKIISEHYRGSFSAWQVHVLEMPQVEIVRIPADPLYADRGVAVMPPAWRFATVLEIHHEERVYDMCTPDPHGRWVLVVEPTSDGLYAIGAESSWTWDEPDDESMWPEDVAAERMVEALAAIGVPASVISTGGGCWAANLELPEGHTLNITSGPAEGWSWQIYREGEQLLAGYWTQDVTGVAKRTRKLLRSIGTICA